MMVDLVNKYDISPREVTVSREKETYEMFLRNDILFLRGWPAFLNEYPNLVLRKDLRGQIEMVPTPHFKSGKPASVFGGWNLMVSRFSPNVEEAVIFIKYLLSREAQEILFKEGGYIPINQSIYEGKVNERLKFYERIIASGVHRPFLENYTKISDIIVAFLNKAIKEELTVDQALNNAAENITKDNIAIK
jgi:multiple sugar transport system substrate-binding protein